MSHNILYEIFKYLDIKSIENLQNTTRIFKMGNKLFTDTIKGISIKSKQDLIDNKERYKLHRCIRLDFNEELTNELDEFQSLERLYYGDTFNQILGNSLEKMKSLKELYFGNEFDTHLNLSLLGLNIEKIVFGDKYNKSIHLHNSDDNRIIWFLSRLGSHELNNVFYRLPLKEIIFGDNFNQDLSYQLYNIPIKKLKLGKNFDSNIYSSKCYDYVDIVPTIEYLSIYNKTNKIYEFLFRNVIVKKIYIRNRKLLTYLFKKKDLLNEKKYKNDLYHKDKYLKYNMSNKNKVINRNSKYMYKK